MKDYKDITWRYLKEQKKRAILTVFGIILSVALISAIGTMIVSVRGQFIKEAIREYGRYHAGFIDMDKEKLDKIKNHVEVEEYGLVKDIGYGAVKETTEIDRERYGEETPPYRYIEVKGYDKKALELLPCYIDEGRFPEKPNEIAITDWSVNYFHENIKIGDKITLPMGERNFIDTGKKHEWDEKIFKEEFVKTHDEEYTVVGLLKSQYYWGGQFEATGVVAFEANSHNNKYDIYITIPDIKNAQEKIEGIAKDIGIEGDIKENKNIRFNERLLRLSAESINETFNETIMGILIFVVVLIIIATIAVIYNAFNISVLERINQFGLLRSIGATPSQIKRIVFKEAFILSIIGIPLGLFFGIFAMKVVLYIIGLLKYDFAGLFNDMEIILSIPVLLISTVLGLITVCLSANGPAKQAAKVSPLEAIRSTGSVKKENLKKIKGSGVVRKVFGIEGEIAHKNLKRNRKRFIITIFSMSLSIILFITFSSFSDYMFKIGAVEHQEMGDFNLTNYNGNDYRDRSRIYNELKNIEDVERVYDIKKYHGDALVENHKISKNHPQDFSEKVNGLTYVQDVLIMSIGDDNFDALKSNLQKGIVSKSKMDAENGVIVVNNTYAFSYEKQRHILMEGFKFNPGDEIKFSQNILGNYWDNKDFSLINLKVMGVLDKGVLDEEYHYNGGIIVITTEKVFENIVEQIGIQSEYQDYYIKMKEDGNKENIIKYLDSLAEKNTGYQYIDYEQLAKENRAATIVISIFLYGFVTVIALISSINIINTISTNILLRKREIAMIKAVGMTQKSIKRMIALEGVLYGIYAAVFGGIIGTGLSYILYRIVIGLKEFTWTIPWNNIIASSIGGIIIALLSGIYPLKRINEGIIVENIRAEE